MRATARHERATPPSNPRLERTDPKKLLETANTLFEGLEYERVLPYVRELVTRPGVDDVLRMDAYLLEGSCLAILGDPIEAEKPFRFLLRGRPDFDMDANTPPKILAVFRKVQVEEKAIVEQMARLERARLIAGLTITGDWPENGTGGEPMPFRLVVKDTRAVVDVLELHYRRNSDGPFSALPLTPDETGRWVGSIPGEWTASERAYALEYFVISRDTGGEPLLQVGSTETPRIAQVAAGLVETPVPIYETAWFWIAVSSVVAASAVATYVAVDRTRQLPDSDLDPLHLR